MIIYATNILMKKLFIVAVLLCIITVAVGQDCKNYYYLLNNAEVEMTISDAQGSPAGKTLYKVTTVNKEGSDMVSDFTSTFLDKSGKEVTSGQGKFKCSGGVAFIDMKMNMPSMPQLKDMKMEAKTTDAFLTYPAGLAIGQALPDGRFEMESNANGMEMQMALSVRDRKVAGKEKVTSPAGSWDCYKITARMEIQMKIMGMGVPISLETTEWFAPGFGQVKTASHDKNGKLMGGTLITALKK